MKSRRYSANVAIQVAIGNSAVAMLHLCFLNIFKIIHKYTIKNTVSSNNTV